MGRWNWILVCMRVDSGSDSIIWKQRIEFCIGLPAKSLEARGILPVCKITPNEPKQSAPATKESEAQKEPKGFIEDINQAANKGNTEILSFRIAKDKALLEKWRISSGCLSENIDAVAKERGECANAERVQRGEAVQMRCGAAASCRTTPWGSADGALLRNAGGDDAGDEDLSMDSYGSNMAPLMSAP
jgi:hypothetical protein